MSEEKPLTNIIDAVTEERDALLLKVKSLEDSIKAKDDVVKGWISKANDYKNSLIYKEKEFESRVSEYEKKHLEPIFVRVKTAIKLILGKK